jgi:hypothetical protein
MLVNDKTKGLVRSLMGELRREWSGSGGAAEPARVEEIERYLAAATKLIEESRYELQRSRQLFIDEDGAAPAS